MKNAIHFLIAFVFALGISQNLSAQEGNAAELAEKTQNLIANMISVPFQNNTNFGVGKYNRSQNILNIQPVLPVSLGR